MYSKISDENQREFSNIKCEMKCKENFDSSFCKYYDNFNKLILKKIFIPNILKFADKNTNKCNKTEIHKKILDCWYNHLDDLYSIKCDVEFKNQKENTTDLMVECKFMKNITYQDEIFFCNANDFFKPFFFTRFEEYDNLRMIIFPLFYLLVFFYLVLSIYNLHKRQLSRRIRNV